MNLILVESDLQLKNAKSYVEHNDVLADRYVAISRSSELGSIDEQSYCDSNFSRLNFYARRGSKIDLLLGLFSICAKLLPFFNVRNIIVGDYRSSWMMLFIRIARPKHVVFVDDGASTIGMMGKLASGDFSLKATWNVYTRYNLDAPFIKRQNVLVKYKGLDQIAVIVGSPFVEAGIFDLDRYFRYLKAIKEIINSKGMHNILYYPHRREMLENINTYVGLLGFDVRKSGSIEVDFETAVSIPMLVCGFYSTALLNIADEYNGVRVIAFGSNFISSVLPASVEVYSYIESLGAIEFEVLND